MKYRLKDRGLQRQLDDLSAGDFTNSLQKACSSNVKCAGYIIPFGPIYRRIQNYERPKFYAYIHEDERPKFAVLIHKDEIEQYDEECSYSSWNKYPEVEPPLGVWMRCETEVNASDKAIRHVAKFDGTKWRDYQSNEVVVHRFKLWDED